MRSQRKEQLARLDERRGSSASRGYGQDWRRLREQILAVEPLCRFCTASGLVVPATEVDHIEPISKRPDLRLTPSNLRPLCTPCHSRLTASGSQEEWGCGVDGWPRATGHHWNAVP